MPPPADNLMLVAALESSATILPCYGLKDFPSARHWLQSLSDPLSVLESKEAVLINGVIHSRKCCNMAHSSDAGVCMNCRELWTYKSCGGRTQGAKRGPLYNAVKKWLFAQSQGRMSRQDFRSLLKNARRNHVKHPTAGPAQPLLSGQAQALCKAILNLDKHSRLSQSSVDELLEHMNNSWRTENFVHGRRYAKDSVNLAMSQLLAVKNSSFIRRAMTENRVAILPTAKTLKRRVSSRIVHDFGIQPVSTFEIGRNVLPCMRAHCCNERILLLVSST